ncbi:alpha/beta hydrolase [Nocardioides dongkuii]|uniref:alpha/beta hydrolase n=1 Tax=Nocardioides dongkuii TaxID=2760089 RepID=UPI0015FA90AF|nr:alpha/beta fold hydrolase [Nocardioides dongkuii]
MPTFVQEAPGPSMTIDGGLRVHLRNADHASALVVFVHGLSGSGYGTWGEMPGAVYRSDRLDADIAVFDYVSGFRRRLGFSPNIIDVARELNSHLDALQYKRIILVGHSMGGIICSMAIRLSHQKTPFGHSQALIHRAVGLIALASPRSGARAVILGGQKDARVLRVHNAEVTQNSEFFTNQVDTQWRGSGRARYRIPIWAATATHDRFVDYFTATFALRGDQVDTFTGTHTSFLHRHDIREWVVERAARSLAQADVPLRATRSVIKTRFRGDPLHSAWHDAFHGALRRFEVSPDGITIYDATHEPREDDTETHLQVRIIPSGVCDAEATATEFREYGLAMESGRLFALGAAPLGEDVDEAARRLAGYVEERPAAWIAPVSEPQNLEDEILNWLERTKESMTHANRFDRGYE